MTIRSLFYIALVLTGSLSGGASAISVEEILENPLVTRPQISITDTTQKVYLQTPFAKPYITNFEEYQKIKDRTILSVNLVYTTYAQSPTFEQTALNRKRLQELRERAPELFENHLIEWKVTAQTSCQSPEEGRQYFHGFVITYRPEPDKTRMKKEVKELNRLLSGKSDTPDYKSRVAAPIAFQTQLSCENEQPSKGYSFNSNTPSFRHQKDLEEVLTQVAHCLGRYPDKKEGKIITKFTTDIAGHLKQVQIEETFLEECESGFRQILEDSIMLQAAREGGRRVKSQCTFTLRVKRTDDPRKAFWMQRMGSLPDSTVFEVFQRHPEWDSILLVTDVTGSMYPFTAQVLLWQRQMIGEHRIRHFVFFNDGDGRPDVTKEIGNAGGVYHLRTGKFSELRDTVFRVMQNGGGGDRSENNVEAVLKGIEKCPGCQHIVMIADNYATPRDMGLIQQIERPVHVILCGIRSGVNMNYLELVRQNGGTLHTRKQDIYGLSQRDVGEFVEIGEMIYKIQENEIILQQQD